MSYSIKILDCHGGCSGCYEAEIRACHGPEEINLPAILNTIERLPSDCEPPTIHGGEPLILSLEVLERLLSTIHRRWGRTGIQTSLPAITLASSFHRSAGHLQLFKRYNTHVGVSIDGSNAETNAGRWDAVGDAENRTTGTLRGIALCKEMGIPVSAIIVLRQANAGSLESIVSMQRFIGDLGTGFGIKDFRLNPFISKNEAGISQELRNSQLLPVWCACFGLMLAHPGLNIQPFRDVIDLMMGFDMATCNFNGCDPYSTTGEQTIMADGTMGGCLKTGMADNAITGQNDGRRQGYRAEMLGAIPFSLGGCNGCQWFPICQGGCPGEGTDNDWRNRSRFCESWAGLYSFVHDHLTGLFPCVDLALMNRAGSKLDSAAVMQSISQSTWRQNSRPSVGRQAAKQTGTVNASHGDVPHGDSHGDSNRPEGRR